MHPELIKAEMRVKGVSPTALAEQLGVSSTTMSQVIHGRSSSQRVAEAIARVLGKPVSAVFPKKTSLRRTKVAA